MLAASGRSTESVGVTVAEALIEEARVADSVLAAVTVAEAVMAVARGRRTVALAVTVADAEIAEARAADSALRAVRVR